LLRTNRQRILHFIGSDFLDSNICAFLGLIRADQPNPRSPAGYSASRWPADEHGCDGFSLIECAASIHGIGCAWAAPGYSLPKCCLFGVIFRLRDGDNRPRACQRTTSTVSEDSSPLSEIRNRQISSHM